ncbi:ZYRO0A12298p [Zygosaccharomyces rouxii]|uniref:ZYRO0A12298p n=1 Tax=Zygosaccharomyces rouxii (strain ATCC 2623 / CBS 732 / NBRC 1130 / NCYC 568 / NRRL Y-229) TaxID=559307 RepID=C5DNX0_ZYGRC|nr:uncharacterized protein ZYRO0A12298g [Zygosaccharomyces rouxii]KAH9198515.1 RanBP1 domain-containing protein [Zygosaccharomyces rouxii]CAR25961.1 ZYRO0A12298p [Zygosaccharomyces rouxii]
MAKRIADSQITRETFREEGSDSDNENGSSSTSHGVAPASVMSKRKIAMPKRKGAGGFNFQPKPSNVDNNNNNNKPSAESQMSNAFNIFKKTQPNDNGTNNDTNAKLKALNLQFKDKVVEIVNKDSFADLRPALDKYKQYIEPLKVEKPLPPIAKSNESDKKEEVASSSEDEEEIKVEGPKFTVQSKPTTSNSVFSFGAKKAEPKRASESDSEDEIEIKGPQFTFNGEVKSDIFKLNKPAEEKKENQPPANPFQQKDSESSLANLAKPASSFGNTNTDTTKPLFNFGQSNSQEEPPKKPTFSFGQPSSEGEPPKKPAFSFGQPKPEEEAAKKPTFSFGQPKPEDGTSKKPSFNFGQPKPEEEAAKKPSFSFGFKPSTPASDASEKSDNKSSFSFKFGQEKPQKDSQAENPKPIFSFGNPAPAANGEKKADAKPAFSFGSSNSSTAPSFSFPKPNNTNDSDSNGTTTTNTDNAPSGGFKFSLPFSQKPASQTSPSSSLSATPQQEESKPEENKEEPSNPIEMQNGEENENLLFSQRSKLMIFNNETKSYDSRGVGELKLLQNKEDKSKVRFLCRSDGMGNILLNTSLVKSFTYSPLTPESENLIKVPVVEAQGKLTTYVAKFKQKSDGRLLVKSVEDVKKDM